MIMHATSNLSQSEEIGQMKNENYANETIETTDNAKKEEKTLKDIIWEDRKVYLAFIIFFAIVVILSKTVFINSVVVSGSMEPTLKVGDATFCVRTWNYKPNRGDIILYAESEDATKNTDYLCKRVIGIPGDEIYFEDGYLYLNGEKQDEPYVMTPGTTEYLIESEEGMTYVVPEGGLFLMGDNREGSGDSRIWTDHYAYVSAVRAKYVFKHILAFRRIK